MIYYLAALAAALSWAISSILAADPSKALGAIAFVRLRMAMVFVMLAAWIALTGGWRSLEAAHVAPALVSGFIGILIGDAALFAAMNRLGPRRAGMLFASNAVFSVILGWLFLNERLGLLTLSGIVIALIGVVLAILYGKRSSQIHEWEAVKGPLWIGVAIGLFSGLCQAVGALIARPVMTTGVDPATIACIRVGVAALGLTLAMHFIASTKAKTSVTPRMAAQIALSGLAAMGIGMTLLLYALRGGNVGVVTTLSATTPAIVLPMLWWRTGERPPAMAWVGAGLVIVGSGLIFAG